MLHLDTLDVCDWIDLVENGGEDLSLFLIDYHDQRGRELLQLALDRSEQQRSDLQSSLCLDWEVDQLEQAGGPLAEAGDRRTAGRLHDDEARPQAHELALHDLPLLVVKTVHVAPPELADLD